MPGVSYSLVPPPRLFLFTVKSVFKWGQGGASIEGVDEATIGLLDEHRLSVHDLGRRYCTSLNPNRPEHSQGMDEERATQVRGLKGRIAEVSVVLL